MNDTASLHRQAWDLIPWIANGSASQAERLAVQAHLACCPDCSQELEFQRQLQASMALEPTLEVDSQQAWQQLRARLTGDAAPASAPRVIARRVRSGRRSWVPWLTAAMVVQALGLGVLGVAFWSRSPSLAPAGAAAPYKTLSAPEATPAQATIRAVFAPDMTLQRLHALLVEARLQVLAGPSNTGVWSLGPAADSTQAATQSALQQLRADSQVRFAEAVGSAP